MQKYAVPQEAEKHPYSSTYHFIASYRRCRDVRRRLSVFVINLEAYWEAGFLRHRICTLENTVSFPYDHHPFS